MRLRDGLAAVAVGATLTGCGSSPLGGSTLFARACSSCHSLSGREDPRRQGGDLLHLRIGRAAMVQFAQEMPVRHPLSAAQVQRVAAYVRLVEAQGR